MDDDNVIDIASVSHGAAASHSAAAHHALPPDARTCWFDLPPRRIAPEDWARYRESVAEIFEAFGMDLDTPGTEDTPDRFLRALFEATAGYEGDAKLATTFPAETVGKVV